MEKTPDPFFRPLLGPWPDLRQLVVGFQYAGAGELLNERESTIRAGTYRRQKLDE